MKPRKKREPEYRFGGNKASWYTNHIVIKTPKPKKGKCK